jgi:bifunctional DNA-binding transcriptional regulator/antitoxin component of YhaV-PrlF toxin-antitoxin module
MGGGRKKGGLDPRLVDPRNRVALPRSVLRALGLRPGDYVCFVADGSAVRLRKVELRVQPDPPDRHP